MPGGGPNEGIDSVDPNATVLSQRYIATLNRDDVLLGRGRPVVRYEGNIRFRRLVQNRKAQYRSTDRNIVKDSIAREIVQTVNSRGGRFLRKIESLEEAIELGVPTGVQAWVIADGASIIQKVKQAFRDEQRAELESECAHISSEQSHAREDEHASSVPFRLEHHNPAAAQGLELLMNRGGGFGQHASLASQHLPSSLEQTLSMLRAAEHPSRQHLQHPTLHYLNPYSEISGNDTDLSRLRSLLAGGHRPATLRDANIREQVLSSLPGHSSDALSNLLRVRALADLEEERQRQEEVYRQGQLQEALARLQHRHTVLPVTLDGRGHLPALNIGQLTNHQRLDNHPMEAGDLEREILIAQGRLTLPSETTDSRVQPLPSLNNQIAPADFMRYLTNPLSANQLGNTSEQSGGVATAPTSAHSLSTIRGIRDGSDRNDTNDSSLPSSALEEWLRNHSRAASESKRR